MAITTAQKILNYASASVEPKPRYSVPVIVTFLLAMLLPLMLAKLIGTDVPRWVFIALPLGVLAANYAAAFHLLSQPDNVRGDSLVILGVLVSGLIAMFALLVVTIS